MARVRLTAREEMATEDQKFWDQIAGRRGEVANQFRASLGDVANNFRAMLLAPDLASRVDRVGGYFRTMTEYDFSSREVIILAVARELSCQYMWSIHERAAPGAGVSSATIDALRRRSTDGLSPREKTIVDYVWASMRNKVTDDAFKAVVKVLGEREAVALSLHVGYATMLALYINTFQVELPTSLTPLLPAT